MKNVYVVKKLDVKELYATNAEDAMIRHAICPNVHAVMKPDAAVQFVRTAEDAATALARIRRKKRVTAVLLTDATKTSIVMTAKNVTYIAGVAIIPQIVRVVMNVNCAEIAHV